MKLKHRDYNGQGRFITFCTHNRLPLLTNEHYCEIVINTIDEMRKAREFKLISYVIMPEHVHSVFMPKKDTRIGLIIGDIKRITSKKIHEHLAGNDPEMIKKFTVIRNRVERFAFWQRRCYDHNCRDRESLWQKVEYCHMNPLKRGVVKNLADWKWSSYNFYNGNEDCVLKMDI